MGGVVAIYVFFTQIQANQGLGGRQASGTDLLAMH